MGDLGYREHITGAAAPLAPRPLPGALFEHLVQVGPGSLPGWHQAEEQPGEERDHKSEAEYLTVNTDLLGARQVRGQRGLERTRIPTRFLLLSMRQQVIFMIFELPQSCR